MATPSHAPKLLTIGPIPTHMRNLFAPMVIGVFAMISVNLVDTYFVSLIGTQELAAMSFTFPVVGLVINLCFGLSIGVTATLSRVIGAGNEERAQVLAGHALIFATLLSVSLAIITLLGQSAVFRLMGADDLLIPLLTDYIFWWALGLPFLVVLIVNNSILRSRGDSKTPMRIMLMAAFLNALFDPILIFGWGPIPALQLEGAAIATMLARMILFGISVRYVMKHGVVFTQLNSKALLESLRPIMSVGIPASITNALTPFSAGLITAVIALHGAETIAGYGMAVRLEGLFLLVPMVMGGALSPVVGQNWGAHLNHRVIEALGVARKVSIIWGIFILIIVEIFASSFAHFFSHDLLVRDSFTIYLRIISLSYVFQGLISAANATFNAIDRPFKATLVSLLNSLLLALPLVYLGHYIYGFTGIVIGLLTARIISGLLANYWIWKPFDPQDIVIAFSDKRVKTLVNDFEAENPTIALKLEELIEEIGHLHAVHLAESNHGEIGFYVGEIEMGHIHFDGHIDIRLPPQLRDAIIHANWGTHHRQHYDGCWVSHHLNNPADFEEVSRLLNLCHLYYESIQYLKDTDQDRQFISRDHKSFTEWLYTQLEPLISEHPHLDYVHLPQKVQEAFQQSMHAFHLESQSPSNLI